MTQERTRTRSHGSAVVRQLVALVVVLVAATGAAGRAQAHAELLEITPADGAVVDVAPAEAVLRFTERVSLTGGSAGVLDNDATVVSTGAEIVDDWVVIALPGDLADGTYTVTWAVVSADSHRITGASVFHVGAPSAGGAATVETGGDGAGWGVRFGAGFLSAIAYAGALIGVGGWWWMLLLAGRREDERLEVPAGPAWLMVVTRAMVLGAVTLVAALPFRIARLGGGLDALGDDDFLSASLRGPIGLATAITVIALLATLVLMAAARTRPVAGWIGAGTSAAALAGFAVEGHTRSQRPLALIAGFDVVHLAAAALWIGGIAGLVVAFRTAAEPDLLGRMVRRFSRAAVASVVVVAGAGVAMAWIVLPAPGDLVSTGYGLALLTKVALVAVVVALGAYNNRRLVSAVSAAGAASAQPRRRLARTVQVELAVLLAAVAVTAVLVARSPVSSTSAAPPPATVPADAVELPLSGGAGTASLSVAPGRTGSNEMRVLLRDPSGRPLDPVDTPTVELTEPALQLGPLRPVVHPLAVGDFHVIADIPIAGRWDVTIRVRVSEFDAATATTTVEIGA